MKRTRRQSEVDDLIDQITTDANGEAEQLWAFRQAFEDEVAVPCDASVIGEPVQVLRFDFDGNERRGLTLFAAGRMAQSMWWRQRTWWPLQARQARSISQPTESGWGLRPPLPAFVVRPGASRLFRFLAPQAQSSWWFCRSGRKQRVAVCWAATRLSRSVPADSGTWCPGRFQRLSYDNALTRWVSPAQKSSRWCKVCFPETSSQWCFQYWSVPSFS